MLPEDCVRYYYTDAIQTPTRSMPTSHRNQRKCSVPCNAKTLGINSSMQSDVNIYDVISRKWRHAFTLRRFITSQMHEAGVESPGNIQVIICDRNSPDRYWMQLCESSLQPLSPWLNPIIEYLTLSPWLIPITGYCTVEIWCMTSRLSRDRIAIAIWSTEGKVTSYFRYGIWRLPQRPATGIKRRSLCNGKYRHIHWRKKY